MKWFLLILLLMPFVFNEVYADDTILNITTADEGQSYDQDAGVLNVCDVGNLKADGNFIRIYVTDFGIDCLRQWAEWDISTVSDDFDVIKVELQINMGATNGRNCDFTLLDTDPFVQSAFDQFNAIAENSTVINSPSCATTDTFTIDLGPNATAYLNDRKSSETFFWLGWHYTDESKDGIDHTTTWSAATAFLIVTSESGIPEAVDDLTISNLSNQGLDLDWTTPYLSGGTLNGSQINFTTPHGDPLTIITNNTNSTTNAVSVSGLAQQTPYSFRVSVWTEFGNNANGSIANTTTLFFGNFTVGAIDLESVNLDFRTWVFARTDLNSSAYSLSVIYPDTYNATCSFHFKFANIDSVHSNLVTTIPSGGKLEATFLFNNTADEVIDVLCNDETDPTTPDGRYLLTQADFILLRQFDQFRDGTFGTMGMFGALDLITLFGIIFATIGFNRINESVGGFFLLVILGVMAFFEIIVWPTALSGAIAVVIMLVVMSTRKV